MTSLKGSQSISVQCGSIERTPGVSMSLTHKVSMRLLLTRTNSKRKVPYQMAKAKAQHIKRIDNNCHISDLVQTFSYVEKW